MPDISMEPLTLGTIICRFTVPQTVIDEINNDYDNAKDLSAHNKNLAGKIADEFKCTEILSKNTKDLFTTCFRQYLLTIKKPFWHVSLENAWINDMKANEYNPFHYHTSKMTDLGLSSVLMLKRPNTYGKEYSREDTPSNGMLEFTGGQQDPLSISQNRVNAKVGELYVFPYTLLHQVYPFNSKNKDDERISFSFICKSKSP